MLRIGVGVYATGSWTGDRRGAAGASAFVTTLVGRALVAAAPAVEHIGERECAVVGPAQDHPWPANTDAVLARLIRRTEARASSAGTGRSSPPRGAAAARRAAGAGSSSAARTDRTGRSSRSSRARGSPNRRTTGVSPAHTAPETPASAESSALRPSSNAIVATGAGRSSARVAGATAPRPRTASTPCVHTGGPRRPARADGDAGARRRARHSSGPAVRVRRTPFAPPARIRQNERSGKQTPRHKKLAHDPLIGAGTEIDPTFERSACSFEEALVYSLLKNRARPVKPPPLPVGPAPSADATSKCSSNRYLPFGSASHPCASPTQRTHVPVTARSPHSPR